MTLRPLCLLPIVTALVACGPPLRLVESGAQTAKPKPTTEPRDDAKDESDAHADGDDKPADDKKKKPEKKKKGKGPHRWKDYAGPKAKTVIASKMVWAVVPVGLDGDFGVAKTAFLEYVKAEGDDHLVKVFGDDAVYVPQALVQSAVAAKNLKPGAPLLVNAAAASAYGRVVEVSKGEGGAPDRVKLKYVFGGQVSDAEASADEVVALEDKVSFGQPASFPSGADREVGTVVFTDADGTYLLSGAGKLVKASTKDVAPTKTLRPHKPGYNATAPAPIALKKGKITGVLDGGLRYKFKPDAGGEELTLPFHLVTIP
jgi:hypothetical protein